MADVADVENALKAVLVAAIYPSGTNQPSAIALNAAHVPVAIMRGWPEKLQLQKDLAAGLAVINILPQPNGDQDVTRWPSTWQTADAAIGAPVGVPVTNGLVRVIRQISRSFQLSLWCSTPEMRDAVGAFVSGVMAGKGTESGRRPFIALADNSAARLWFVSTNLSDDPELIGLFRRNWIYGVEYFDLEYADGTPIKEFDAGIDIGGGGAGTYPDNGTNADGDPAPAVIGHINIVAT